MQRPSRSSSNLHVFLFIFLCQFSKQFPGCFLVLGLHGPTGVNASAVGVSAVQQCWWEATVRGLLVTFFSTEPSAGSSSSLSRSTRVKRTVLTNRIRSAVGSQPGYNLASPPGWPSRWGPWQHPSRIAASYLDTILLEWEDTWGSIDWHRSRGTIIQRECCSHFAEIAHSRCHPSEPLKHVVHWKYFAPRFRTFFSRLFCSPRCQRFVLR
jgi:hypothetical protein